MGSKPEAVDLIAIPRGKIDELNAEADLKSMITHKTRRTHLMAVGETKTQRNS